MNRTFAEDRPNEWNGFRRNGSNRPPAVAMKGLATPGFMSFDVATDTSSLSDDSDRHSVRWNEAESRFLMEDSRIVTRANRAFCLRLIEVLVRSDKIRAAHLDFSRHRLAFDFADRSIRRPEAARVLGESIRLAGMPVQVGSGFESLSKRYQWDCFAVFAVDRQPSCWWWVELANGVVRIDGTGLKAPGVDPRSWPGSIPGLRQAGRRRLARGVTLRFDGDKADPWNILAAIDTLCRVEEAIDERLPRRAGRGLSPVSRIAHLGMAGCSMTCAVVGVLIPGVPTVPFVLLTSYHLAKTSNRLHDLFRRMPLFGSLGEDWEQGRFIRNSNKVWIISISTGVLVLSLAYTQPGGFALLAIGVIYTLTTLTVLTAPGSPRNEEHSHQIAHRRPALLPG